LVELDLLVLSFIHNYNLLKYYTINLKNIVKNVSGSNRQKKIRTFSPGSASAKKLDVLIEKTECMRTRKYPINYTAKIIFGIVDISKQRYKSFVRFEKGFLGRFGENF